MGTHTNVGFEVGARLALRSRAALVVVLAAIACATSAAPACGGDLTDAEPVLREGARAAPGLTRLEAGKIDGRLAVRGTFEENGKKIFFETRRGPRTPWIERLNGAPPYEMDVCFRTEADRPIWVSTGGDRALIPACDPEGPDAHAKTPSAEELDPDTLAANYELLRNAMKALTDTAFEKKFAPEHHELTGPLPFIGDLPFRIPGMSAGGVVHEGEGGSVVILSAEAGRDPGPPGAPPLGTPSLGAPPLESPPRGR